MTAPLHGEGILPRTWSKDGGNSREASPHSYGVTQSKRGQGTPSWLHWVLCMGASGFEAHHYQEDDDGSLI